MGTLQIVQYTDMTFGRKDFRLPLQRIRNLRSCWILRSVKWEFVTVVTGQHISSIFKCQTVQ